MGELGHGPGFERFFFEAHLRRRRRRRAFCLEGYSSSVDPALGGWIPGDFTRSLSSLTSNWCIFQQQSLINQTPHEEQLVSAAKGVGQLGFFFSPMDLQP